MASAAEAGSAGGCGFGGGRERSRDGGDDPRQHHRGERQLQRPLKIRRVGDDRERCRAGDPEQHRHDRVAAPGQHAHRGRREREQRHAARDEARRLDQDRVRDPREVPRHDAVPDERAVDRGLPVVRPPLQRRKAGAVHGGDVDERPCRHRALPDEHRDGAAPPGRVARPVCSHGKPHAAPSGSQIAGRVSASSTAATSETTSAVRVGRRA